MSKKCKNCKTENQVDAIYCGNCGTELASKIVSDTNMSGKFNLTDYMGTIIVIIISIIMIIFTIYKIKEENIAEINKINTEANATEYNATQEVAQVQTESSIKQAIVNAHNAGDFSDAKILADSLKYTQAQPAYDPNNVTLLTTPLEQVKMPENGHIKRHKKFSRDTVMAPLEIKTEFGENYFVKLKDSYSKNTIITIFIKGGNSVTVDVPIGSYDFVYASGGDIWFGEQHLFGKQTGYSTIDTTLEFTYDGYQVLGHTLTLYKVVNGNMQTQSISADEF